MFRQFQKAASETSQLLRSGLLQLESATRFADSTARSSLASTSFSDWAPRTYPFKPPLKRIKVEGRYMPNPAAQGVLTRRQPAGRQSRVTGPTQQQLRVKLPSSSEQAVVQVGRRIGRPNFRRIRRVRSAAASTDAADKPLVTKHDIWTEEALSHNSGLQILFLGTGRGHPAEQRRVGSLALKLPRSTWLFDCGEDTQRQIQKQPLIRHGKLDRIFITSCSTSNILGLPGMLCTMSAAREVGLDLADIPLHLYGPPGLAEFIRPLLQLSDTYISMPVIVHEFVSHAVTEAEMTEPKCLDRRSCLYRVLLPPDKLNPNGHVDGEISPLLTRAYLKTQQKGLDERSNPRKLDLPPPGNPEATLEGMQDLRWTIKCDREFTLTAARVEADSPAWSFICKEGNRVGTLSVEQCQKLNVDLGPKLGLLKEGRRVMNLDHEWIYPEQVIGPDIRGRKVVIIGESKDSSPVADLAKNANVVIHSASTEVKQVGGLKTLKSTIGMASAFCKAADAEHLLLYRFKPGLEGGRAPYRAIDNINAQADAAEQNEATFLKELNTIGRINWTRKEALGGYLGRARNHWDPVDSPVEVVEAAEQFAAEKFGRPRRVSVADDMDLFAVERVIPKVDWEASAQSAQRAAIGQP